MAPQGNNNNNTSSMMQVRNTKPETSTNNLRLEVAYDILHQRDPLVTNEEITTGYIADILIQLVTTNKEINSDIRNTIKAAAIYLQHMHRQPKEHNKSMEDWGKVVKEHITTLGKEINEELTSRFKIEQEERVKWEAEMKSHMDKLKNVMEKATRQIKTIADNNKENNRNTRNTEGTRSYADIAAIQTPVQTTNMMVPGRHANVIGRGKMHDRQIIIRGDSALTELTEIELVGKANKAIDLTVKEKLIQKIENPFIGATKMHNGQIIYMAMTKEIVEIIKEPGALAAFQCKFGRLSMAHTRLYYMLVEFVPVLFNDKAQSTKYKIERENTLQSPH
ncbi:hypothetical protein AX17_005168 [Amanita inopinata Kibby_2008]|nr:hypothetical protein AX17_005168 [Amanita inopinata Kibby_2008]